jgi:hypothetical protein
VSIEAEYTSDLDYFDFDSDMEPMVIARAMAREQWDRQYFSRLRSVLELTEIYYLGGFFFMIIKYVIFHLREAHQNHYEQFGTVKGTFRINKVIFVTRVSVIQI